MPENPYARRSARVIVVDSQDRVLLFRFFANPKRKDQGHLWITPGGGVDEGEELHAAAVRELREETGFTVPPDERLPHIAHSEGYADLEWTKGIFRDDYFFWRTPTSVIDDAGREEWERGQIVGQHWWTLAELSASQERIVPPSLGEVLKELLAGRIPGQPLALPWHH